VDICAFEPSNHIGFDSLDADPPAAGRAVRERVAAAGLLVADLFAIRGSYADDAPNHPDAAVRAERRAWFPPLLEAAAEMGAGGITLLPGIEWAGETRASSLARAAEELAWRAEQASAVGLRCSFEPAIDSIVNEIDDVLRVCAQAPGLTATLDYSHFVYRGIAQSEVEKLHPVTGHVHLRQAAPGIMQARHHEGTIDFGRIVTLLVGEGYEGFLSLEYLWDTWFDCDRTDVVSESLLLADAVRAELGVASAGRARPPAWT
jgi:sugar phosphate isomerase/epimerase